MDQIYRQPDINQKQEQFNSLPNVDVPRSRFDRSHGHLTTFDIGNVYPVFCDEILPGDSVEMNATAFCRLATPLRPLMHRLDIDIMFFFCACRLVWENWQKFMGERHDPADDPDLYSIPQLRRAMSTTAPTAANMDNWHYFGLPYVCESGTPNLDVNALPFRALALFWNEWLRDQNIDDSVDVPFNDTLDTSTTLLTLHKRNKKRDYFSSCLPWPQKGDAVSVPLGTSAPVTGIGGVNQTYAAGPTNVYETDGSGTTSYAAYKSTSSTNNVYIEEDPSNTGFPNIRADLSNASAITVNALRDAITTQQFFERDARGGTRYIELIQSHFAVTSSDSRLQRTELLAYGVSAIEINPIAQVSESGTTPQGNLAAIGTGLVQCSFEKAFEEHGYLIGIISGRADLIYQRQVNKMWSRTARLDFVWPEFAHLGEQAVENKELFYTGTAT